MGKIALTLGWIVALGWSAQQIAGARMAAQQAQRVLTKEQQQFRKLAKEAEASMVCGNPEIKEAINADKSVDGVQDINWLSIKKTAESGLEKIQKNIETMTLDMQELDQRIRELEEAGKWGELPDATMDEMLHAACQTEGLKNDEGDCGRAQEFGCGWNDPVFMEPIDDQFMLPPLDEPIAAFRAMAEKKLTAYTRLSVPRFRQHCANTLGVNECEELCFEFSLIVGKLAQDGSAVVLGNTETLDEAIAKRRVKREELEVAKAEEDACQKAHIELDAFAAQLGKLSDRYTSDKKNVNRYSRSLRMQKMRLARQIKVLEAKRVELAKAKAIFAAASAQVEARMADVAHMQVVLENLAKALQAQMELIARLEQKLHDIEAATETGRKFKVELSRTLSNTVEYNAQAIHKPMASFSITPVRDIAAEFDDAEVAAAPAMKATVRAVSDYCGEGRVSAALTNPLVEVKGASKPLNFICTGQDWNNMISEAQSLVKKDAKQLVDILLAEKANIIKDSTVPAGSSIKMKEANGEPEGIAHATQIIGEKTGTFVGEYLNPNWKVEVNDIGEVTNIGTILSLYQKLGDSFDEVTAAFEDAKEGARQLQLRLEEAAAEMVKLQKLLQEAIAAKEIAENKMNDAQELVNQAEEMKKKLEASVASGKESLAKGEDDFEATKESLLSEHRERSAALLEVLQELKASKRGPNR